MTKTTPLEIGFTKSATRRARDLTASQLKTMETVLHGIAADPSYRHNNLKPLKEQKDTYRLRLGDWRVTFIINPKDRTLSVTEIQPRGSAY